MPRLSVFLILGLLLCVTDVFSQKRKTKDEIDFEQLVEDFFPMQEDDIDYSDAYEILFQMLADPIDLNNADADELKNLFILSPQQIQSFLNYREKYGRLLTIYELQAVPGFSLEDIKRVLPFVTVRETNLEQDNTTLIQRMLRERNNFLLLRYDRTLEEKAGYRRTDSTAARYLGSPDKYYMRYRVSHTNDFSFGFTAEKDQGEQFIWDRATRRYGADFYSAHLVLHNQGSFKSIAVGDYLMQYGQSLVFGGGFNIGKGAETVSAIRRSTFGVRPYTSVVEGNFFRGGAAIYEKGRFQFMAMYSRMRRDANVNVQNDTITDDEDFISSIQVTGYRRTLREVASKGGMTEQNIGGNITYNSKSKNFQAGVSALHTTYEFPLRRTPSKYNQFEFSGKENLLTGVFWDYNFRNVSFFGEAARSSSGGTGLVAGLLANLSKTVEMSMLFRNYDKNFHTFYGRGFSENSRSINEQGMYWGIKIKPNKRWTITGYYDYFKFPWLRFLTDAPSQGHEYLTRITYSPTKKISLYFHFREEQRKRNFAEGTFNQILTYQKRNFILNCDLRTEKILHLRSRVQFSTFRQNNKTTSGFAIIQDANFDLGKLRFGTRFAVFDTDNYDNRQYTFEKDVLFVFYIPAYYGKGFRNYYIVQYKVGKNIDIWLKYAFTRYKDIEKISSGLEAINGNIKTDVRLQLRYMFR